MGKGTVPVWHAIGPEPCHAVAFRLESRPPTGTTGFYSIYSYGFVPQETVRCEACKKVITRFVAETTLKTG